jgi:hypothetical protein
VSTQTDNPHLHRSRPAQAQQLRKRVGNSSRQMALRISVMTSRRSISSDFPSTRRVLHFPEKIAVQWRDIGQVRWVWGSLLRVMLEEILGHPRIVGRCILELNVDMNNQLSLRWIPAIREECVKQSKGTRFCSMNHVALNDARGGNIVTTRNKPREDSITHSAVRMLFLVAMVLFATSRAFSSLAVHIRL